MPLAPPVVGHVVVGNSLDMAGYYRALDYLAITAPPALSAATYARVALAGVVDRRLPSPAVYASLVASERPLPVRRTPQTRGHIGWVRRAPRRRG
jgi:hypothetical protein